MADISAYTHKWRATTGIDHRSDGKVSKRNRQPVSCAPCRSRKLKCDRGHPCDSCIKRGDEDSCIYGKTTTASATENNVSRRDESRHSGHKAQDRLRHLEELVKKMIEPDSGITGNVSTATSPPLVNGNLNANTTEGALNRRGEEGTSYAGSTHWSAVLEHIYELKNDLGSEYYAQAEDNELSKPDSLFGAARPSSLQAVLQNYLPTRIKVDRRLSQYFNAKYMIIPFIHRLQFQRQYEQFWQDPLGTSPLWISILFSICCLAATLSTATQAESETPPGDISARDAFEKASAQCLILGNYSKCQPFVIEALSLFLQCRYSSSLDPSREVAVVFSIQTRLAYMMGYHRDGSNYPKQFTAFETEMRRRVWAMIKQFDLMVSFQLGIPNTIPPNSWDTKTPTNLHDGDFDEDITVLPPERPQNEPTKILYFSVKSRLIDAYAKVCQHAISFPPNPPTNSEIMALDKEVREMADTVPQVLRIKTMRESVTDPGFLVMVRLNISFLWRKSLCVLHRKYMTQGDNDYSYKTCVEMASSMCETILDIFPEFHNGGVFQNDGWMLTSFTIIDFLLACMTLCLALSVSRKAYVNKGGSPKNWLNHEETKKLLSIVERSQAVCAEFSTRSKEAKRVSNAVGAVLERLKTHRQGQAAGADGTRYFLNMTGESMADTDPKPNSSSDKQSSISLTPLSISDGPTSITPATGMFPPDAYVPDGALLPGKGPISFNAADNAAMFARNHPTGSEGDVTSPFTTSNISSSAPTSLSPDMFDFDLGPFSTIMDGLEGPGQIDWAQLDQFTGLYGQDMGSTIPQPPMYPMFSDQQMQTSDDSSMYSTDWTSTPQRFLGGSLRDPLTGKNLISGDQS